MAMQPPPVFPYSQVLLVLDLVELLRLRQRPSLVELLRYIGGGLHQVQAVERKYYYLLAGGWEHEHGAIADELLPWTVGQPQQQLRSGPGAVRSIAGRDPIFSQAIARVEYRRQLAGSQIFLTQRHRIHRELRIDTFKRFFQDLGRDQLLGVCLPTDPVGKASRSSHLRPQLIQE